MQTESPPFVNAIAFPLDDMTSRLTGRKPPNLPDLAAILEDLGNPGAPEVARFLGVDRSTVSGWMRRGSAPRPAMLALWWITSHGAASLGVEVHNVGMLRMQIARHLEDENARLRRQLARVLAVADFGAANWPVFNAASTAELLAERPRRLSDF